MPTADPSRPSLVRELERELRERDGIESLGVHQRLDRDTTGVVLFTKRAAANPGLAAQFAAGSVRKTYLALVRRPRGKLRRNWSCETRLTRVGRGRMASVAAGGAVARTEFRVVREFPAALLIEARPRTGRKHQIRVQLSESRMPILGDITYGPRVKAAARCLLHAARLELLHPVTGRKLVIESPLPGDFQAALAKLSLQAAGRRQ